MQKNVLNKIQHIERAFKEAHGFAVSETSAGIMEEQGQSTFKDLVKKCPYHYNILEVMIDRASTRPKITSYDLVHTENDSDEEQLEEEEAVHNEVSEAPNEAVARIANECVEMSDVSQMNAVG